MKQEDLTIEKKVKRTRPCAYTFRATEQEKSLIDTQLKKSGLTMTEFIIKSITDKPINVIDGLSEILIELKRQGNNLNQAVKNNYFGYTTEKELLSAVQSCKAVYKRLAAAVGEV